MRIQTVLAHMLRRLTGAMIAAISVLGSTLAAGAGQPNVILINCDDLGYGDLACYGASDIRTPHLDQMAAEGTRLTDFSVTSALCTPSRVSLMTGRYPGRAGLGRGVLRPSATTGLPAEEITVAEVLQSAGYATGAIGKWHLGFEPQFLPTSQGFDSYFGVLHNLDKPETVLFEDEGGMPVVRWDAATGKNVVVKRPAVPSEMTGLYTAEALRFIATHADAPFFLYLAHAMPHLPFDASAPFLHASGRGLYGDVVQELDDSTGQILAELRRRGLAERTLVIFTSDNGPERKTPGTARPLSGSKHTVFEGGLRVPCIVWWPGHVPAGRVCDEFLSTLDLLPTLAALGQAPLPPDLRLDGADNSGVLLGQPGSQSTRHTLYSLYGYQVREFRSMRQDHWKLHLTDPPALYDLASDLGETTNVASAHPDVVESLQKMAQATHADTFGE